MATVSVWITTYNHEKYIAQAIESVLAQIVTHKLEIIIGEDYSTDKTRKIVSNYQKKYPDIIKLYLSDKNIGCNNMFYTTYSLCTGDYIAWLDGDDFWTDPYKLQKQVDILELDDKLMFCFHQVTIADEKSGLIRKSIDPNLNADNTWGMKQFISNINPINTPSFVHRNILKELPTWFYSLSIPDIGFYFLLLQHGNGYFLNQDMAVYRIHDKGAWSGSSLYTKCLKLAAFNESIYDYVPNIYKNEVLIDLCYNYSILLELTLSKGEIKKSLYYLKKIKKCGFIGLINRKKWIVKTIIKIITYPIYRLYKNY